jgi:hypothetical protein
LHTTCPDLLDDGPHIGAQLLVELLQPLKAVIRMLAGGEPAAALALRT